MKNDTKLTFVAKPLAAAVALALSALPVHAAPTPNQMPGAGVITNVNTATTVVATAGYVGGGGVGTFLTNGTSPALLTLTNAGATARAVIQWGGTGAPADAANPAGFNIGSAGKLTFASSGTVTNAAVLNIDASGNPSQIFGTLEASGAGGAAPRIFVSNTNGIIVGASGRIAAPNGIGLIGADLNNVTAKHEFVGNNADVDSYVDVTGGLSPVTIGGAINGSLTTNTPAQFIMVAGSDVTNTGNLFAQVFVSYTGIRAVASKATVNGVTSVTVNRLWGTDSGTATAFDLNATGGVEVALAGSNFINTGSIAATDAMGLFGSGNIRSGTAGSTDPLVGLYTDGFVVTAAYGATSKTELYNIVAGYSTGSTMGALLVNPHGATPIVMASGSGGNVTINTLTPASQSSSITTQGLVDINGANVAINSTIDHKVGTGASGGELYINGTKSVSITADVGARDVVEISSGGTLDITANVTSDTDKNYKFGSGHLFVTNDGTGATTISGKLTSYGSDVRVSVSGPLTISGTVTAANSDVQIYNYGTQAGNATTISGNVTADNWLDIHNEGLTSSKLDITGALQGFDIHVQSNGTLALGTATAVGNLGIDVYGTSSQLNGAITASNFYYSAQAATTKVLPAAVITAPNVYLDVLNFTGVNATGNAYTKLSEKPVAQIVTNFLDLYVRGSINAPIAGNTNWLDNALVIEPLFTVAPVDISLSAVGGGFQAINLKVTGNAEIDSGDTITPFTGIGLTSGTQYAGGLIPNGGSQLIVNATGNLDVWDGFNPSKAPVDAFEFPGGVAFTAGGTLTVHAPVYNAWTTNALPFQGAFFEAPTIVMLGYLATNGNSWGNWSTMPTSGSPTVYQINQLAPTTFGFINNPDAVHKNTYSSLIMGGPTCFTPAPAAWSSCP